MNLPVWFAVPLTTIGVGVLMLVSLKDVVVMWIELGKARDEDF